MHLRLLTTSLCALAVTGSALLAAPALAARPIGLDIPEGPAAGPYTVTAGGDASGTTTFSASSGAVTFTTSGGLNLGCDSSSATGTLSLGASADGVGVSFLDDAVVTNCVGPLGIPMTFTQSQPWRVNLTGPAGTVTQLRVDQIAGHASNPDGQCDFDVAGSVDGNFDSSRQAGNATTPTAGAELDIFNISGCGGLLNEGDTATFEATWTWTSPAGAIEIS